MQDRNTESIRSMEMSNKYYSQPKFEPDPEPLIKLADITMRNDKRLEELLEEFVRNRDKELDKTDEVK